MRQIKQNELSNISGGSYNPPAITEIYFDEVFGLDIIGVEQIFVGWETVKTGGWVFPETIHYYPVFEYNPIYAPEIIIF